jgi:acetolactate synthase-1/2/3 large subunit
MNGAESLVRTALAAGVEICFANPGTTEMPLVAALDAAPGVRAVLGLFEGVCTGAADGWARMAGRPALVLLHLGPGLANGIANLHNARRARSPVVNVVGDHASWHLPFDAPLASDIAGLAAPVSGFLRRNASARELARDFAEAHVAALGPPGRVATLIVPADCQWEVASGPARVAARAAPRGPGPRVEAMAARLRAAKSPALLLGGEALGEAGLLAAARVAAAAGAALLSETFPARIERGRGRARVARLPYFPEQAAAALAAHDLLVLAGAREPVAFFGYPDGRSRLAAPEALATLAAPEDDAVAALAALADALGAPARAPAPPDLPRPEARASGPLDPQVLGRVLAALQPEGAIVVDEGATSGLPYFLAAEAAPPHTTLTLTGGAIGQGLPCAAGAALACPGRRVIALQADGSALYTVQALWTFAREGLDVVVILCANHRYRILQIELARAGIAEPGKAARALTELAPPAIDWVALARSLGVPAARAATAEELAAELRRAFAEPGPRLVEAAL